MILPYEAQKEIHDFFEDIELYKRNIDFTELQFSRGKRNYDRILKRLEAVDLPDPSLFNFKTLSTKEIKELLVEIICKIFGPSYKEEVEKYNRLIRIVPIDNPFEATIESDLVGDMQVPKNIFISNKCKSIQVVSTGHEYTHCFLSKYDTHLFNAIMNNVHYKELLPIIVEYIICYELSLILKENDIEEKHRIIRIDHDKNQAEERKSSIMIEPKLRHLNSLDAQVLKSYIEYQEHNSFGYIISDIYGSFLSDVYKDSPNSLINLIKGIISGDNCIKDLLSYYNLSLVNQEVTTSFNQKIESLSKHK